MGGNYLTFLEEVKTGFSDGRLMVEKISLKVRRVLLAVQVIKHWGDAGLIIVQRNINESGE